LEKKQIFILPAGILEKFSTVNFFMQFFISISASKCLRPEPFDVFDFLPYKPGASHPVASAPFKALKCFCLSPLLAEKFKPPAPRMVADRFACLQAPPFKAGLREAI